MYNPHYEDFYEYHTHIVVVTGFEPVLKEPKSFVLPLHHTTIKLAELLLRFL